MLLEDYSRPGKFGNLGIVRKGGRQMNSAEHRLTEILHYQKAEIEQLKPDKAELVAGLQASVGCRRESFCDNCKRYKCNYISFCTLIAKHEVKP
jgi:hypothetical protein